MSYNFLIACDQDYYHTWGKNFLKSILYFNPWARLHCHIINPTDVDKVQKVNYTYEHKTFDNPDHKVSYYQCSRFLTAAEKFSKKENVITLDCDSVCVKPFTQTDLEELFTQQHVMRHHKGIRWLAGFVIFRNDNFRYDYADLIKSDPEETWVYGRDQDKLLLLAEKYNFQNLPLEWMFYERNSLQTSRFYTLKGTRKNNPSYIHLYQEVIRENKIVKRYLPKKGF